MRHPKRCSVEGCNKKYRCSGYCGIHYNRLWKTGTTDLPIPPTREERFWSKVDKTGDCWLWTAARTNGYGAFAWNPGDMRPAHRVSYEWAKGPIPDGLDVDHMCHTRACVNPAHLRYATRKQNLENRNGAQANSRSGIRGVRFVTCNKLNPWVASVKSNGQVVFQKYFATKEEAAVAVAEARRRFFTHSQDDAA